MTLTPHLQAVRYFYPAEKLLAAAWMAEQYGMVFEPYPKMSVNIGGGAGDPCWKDITDFSAMNIVTCLYEETFIEKLYLHPGSIHLLEPQMGDLVEHDEGEDDRYAVINYDPALYAERHGIKRIVERGGEPFHWPESEAV